MIYYIDVLKQELIQCADDERSRLLLEKMEAEDGKKKAQKEYEDLAEIEHKLGLQFKEDLDETQVNIEHTAP